MRTDMLSLGLTLALTAVARGAGTSVPAPLLDPTPTVTPAAVAQEAPAVTSAEQEGEVGPPAPEQVAEDTEDRREGGESHAATGGVASPPEGPRAPRDITTRATFHRRTRSLLAEMEAALGPIQAISIWDRRSPDGDETRGTARVSPPVEVSPGAQGPTSEARDAGSAETRPEGSALAPSEAPGHPGARPVLRKGARLTLTRMEASLARAAPVSTVAPEGEAP